MATATSAKQYGKTKVCTGLCGKRKPIDSFRLLTSGYRQGMCKPCEREYERERWHTRSSTSKASSGGAAQQRRRSPS